MNIYFALCGNSYSEALSRCFVSRQGFILIHRSNVRAIFGKFRRIIQFIFVLLIRYLILPVINGNFILLVPHAAGNYGKIIRLLSPSQIIVIDDGVTFEYWSIFHDQYILPIFTSSKIIKLVGPRNPNWNELIWRGLESHIISRAKITEVILSLNVSSRNLIKNKFSKNRIGWIIDDGQMLPQLWDQLKDDICSNYKCDHVSVLWHPTRGLNLDILNNPAEVSILSGRDQSVVVIGRASTTLFNVAAYDRNIYVASLPSGYPDLDMAAREQGIAGVNISDYVKN